MRTFHFCLLFVSDNPGPHSLVHAFSRMPSKRFLSSKTDFFQLLNMFFSNTDKPMIPQGAFDWLDFQPSSVKLIVVKLLASTG